jgi:formate C-acetyltransferase
MAKITFSDMPVTPRIKGLRDIYRTAVPSLDGDRTRIITEYYKTAKNEAPIIRRAKALYEILTKMTLRIEDNELIVGNVGKNAKGCFLFAEYGGIGWIPEELASGEFDRRGVREAKMTMEQEERDYLCSVVDFWEENATSERLGFSMPPEYEEVCSAGVLPYRTGKADASPHGHFNANFKKAVDVGFGAIRAEAVEKLEALRGKVFGADAEKYYFYTSVVICCDAVIAYAKRFAALAREKAAECADEKRRAELLAMADSYEWIMEKPARTYWEAMQVIYWYGFIINMEGSFIGLTIGRVDQHAGEYLARDLAAGTITPEFAQEITDCFCLKLADLIGGGPSMMALLFGAYTNNMRLTIGGRKKDGTDATNDVTYSLLQSAIRLRLHDPNLSLCVHTDTPAELFQMGIQSAKINGGNPTFDNADLIISMMKQRGLSDEDSRDFCVIGCVELSGSGNDFANVSAPFSKTHIGIANIVLQAINDGKNPLTGAQGGLHTGYLYEMQTFEDVWAAYEKQHAYFMDWFVTLNTIMEVNGNPQVPVPIASATMDGCMENGRDLMVGGAKYNATGGAAIGIGTAIDSLVAIKYLVYDKKICTARELYDALAANWQGYEVLRQRALTEVPYFGNGDPYSDEIAERVSSLFADTYKSYLNPRGAHNVIGLYSAGAHIMLGNGTAATPNGRLAHTAVSDGASPTQGTDKNGPTGVARSILALQPHKYNNGLQFTMKFHPKSVEGAEGSEKLRQFIWSFMQQGGMQIQYNVVSAEDLKTAQKNPDEYKDMVVRVAGFSAYFVELSDAIQNDLISRTDNQL